MKQKAIVQWFVKQEYFFEATRYSKKLRKGQMVWCWKEMEN